MLQQRKWPITNRSASPRAPATLPGLLVSLDYTFSRMSTPNVENSAVAFRALTPEAGHLSLEEYESRQKACTQEELAKLTSSPEFKIWSENAASANLSNGVKHMLILAYVVVVTSILLAQSSRINMFHSLPVGGREAERPTFWLPNILYSVTPPPHGTDQAASLLESLRKAQISQRETSKELSNKAALADSMKEALDDLEAVHAQLLARVRLLEGEKRDLAKKVVQLSSATETLHAEVVKLRAKAPSEPKPKARGVRFFDQKLSEARAQLKQRTVQKVLADISTPEPLAVADWWATSLCTIYITLTIVQHARTLRQLQSLMKVLQGETETGSQAQKAPISEHKTQPPSSKCDDPQNNCTSDRILGQTVDQEAASKPPSDLPSEAQLEAQGPSAEREPQAAGDCWSAPRPRRAAPCASRRWPLTPVSSCLPKYCESVTQTRRRPTRTVHIGKVLVGSEHPIAKQTMTTTDTRDIRGTVDQVIKCADAGADIVRITVQGKKEAEACCEIREELFKLNYDIPLVADIHFQPAVAMRVADAFEKIRINPGNFVDGAKRFDDLELTDESMRIAKEQIQEGFAPLVEKCKSLGRAMRIGTNHGSLSNRILSWYGDSPRGMVESAFEFADICRDMDYHNFVFSMKASNPVVMVQAYRLLAAEMYAKDWDYPLHLGVTEAGEGEDGRMKSAIGIGSLLLDGLGDTIRVSLTEDPHLEINPCGRLATLGEEACAQNIGVQDFPETRRNFAEFVRRTGTLPEQREGESVDFRSLLHRDGSVLSAITLADLKNPEMLYRKLGTKLVVGMPFKDIATSDSIFMRELPPAEDEAGRKALRRLVEVGVHVVAPAAALEAMPMDNTVALFALKDFVARSTGGAMPLPAGAARFAVTIDGSESNEDLAALKGSAADFAMLEVDEASGLSRMHASRRVFEGLALAECEIPVIHHKVFSAEDDREEVVIRGGSELGCMLVDGLGDGVCIEKPGEDVDFLRTTSFGMLQGSRMRNTKTEYVSCPSCGRTLFDLQEVTESIRVRTGHLPGVSIAIMGCIVNGPGEMADADFGYVGGAPGKIDLYVGKEVVKKGIPFDGATDALIQLIKDHDRWVEPEEVEEEAMATA
eukprot:jgi/Tetstr1/433864/TSEL_023046.t2